MGRELNSKIRLFFLWFYSFPFIKLPAINIDTPRFISKFIRVLFKWRRSLCERHTSVFYEQSLMSSLWEQTIRYWRFEYSDTPQLQLLLHWTSSRILKTLKKLNDQYQLQSVLILVLDFVLPLTSMSSAFIIFSLYPRYQSWFRNRYVIISWNANTCRLKYLQSETLGPRLRECAELRSTSKYLGGSVRWK